MHTYIFTASADGIGIDYEETIQATAAPGFWDCYELADLHGCEFWTCEEVRP